MLRLSRPGCRWHCLSLFQRKNEKPVPLPGWVLLATSEDWWSTCFIVSAKITKAFMWIVVDSGLSFSEDSCSRNKAISSFIYIVGLILYINKSSATTASHLVALLVMKFPKANEAQPLSTIPVKARCSRPRYFVVYSKLPRYFVVRIWEAMNVCPVLAESVISNVSNIVQSRCIKCDWCGLLRIATKSIQISELCAVAMMLIL